MKNHVLQPCLGVFLAALFLAAPPKTALSQPSNDNFANASMLPGFSGVVNGTNVGATNETGEPTIAGSGSLSVWWSWTALSGGTTTFKTDGSSFDTVLGIYTGSAVNALTLVGQDDDGGAGTTSLVTFQAAQGTNYYIAVAGYNGATGNIVLTWNSPQPIPTPMAVDFTTGNPQGWIGGAFPGFGGSTSVGASGLCMFVPGPGDNIVGWVSPERFIPLIDNAVYRVQTTFSTDQSVPNAIPALFIVYDNFNASGGGNNFGGFFWVLDVDGGAEGISRPGGRTVFDVYLTPNSVATPQWRAGAFTPAADPLNDIRLQFRIIDANETILTSQDSGTICVRDIQIQAIPRDLLQADLPVFNAPISMATHFAETLSEQGIGGTAQIDDVGHTARYQLNIAGDNRKTLGPYDPTQSNLNTQLYPVPWQGDALYRVRARIRAESSESDPIEAIFLATDTANSELGMIQYTTRANPGGIMDRAASPRLAAADYESYFFGQNATLSTTPDANRLRPLAFFFNATTLFGNGTGGDAFIVESLTVDKMLPPPTFTPPEFVSDLTPGPGTIFTGETTLVTFAVAISDPSATGSIEVLETDDQGVGTSVTLTLADDGDLNKGDDIAGDGVFHNRMNFSPTMAKHRYFVARIPATNKKSPVTPLVIVDHLTDGQFATLTGFNDSIKMIYDNGVMGGMTVAQIQTMALDHLAANPSMTVTYGQSDAGDGVWWVSPEGVLSFLDVRAQLPERSGVKPPKAAPPREAGAVPARFKEQKVLLPKFYPAPSAPSPNGVTDQTIITESNKALLLAPFFWQFTPTDEFDLQNSFVMKQFEVTAKNNAVQGAQTVTVEDFMFLDDYGVVLITSHGDNYYNGLLNFWQAQYGQAIPFWATNSSQVVVLTGVQATMANKATYEGDLKAQRLAIDVAGGYAILPSFIRVYTGPMPKSCVYIGSCRSSYNATMANAFLGRGAKAFFAYSDYVGFTFAYNHGHTLFNQLLDGMETGSLMGIGEVEPAPDPDPARFDRFGDDHLVIIGVLRNGRFETGNLSGWTRTGDTRVITALGPLRPPEGTYMAIVSTGLGSVSDSQSALSQTFIVPSNAKSLKFRYDVISEEPLEFVGSQFDDQFEVNLVQGMTPTQIARETVNSSAWFPIGGINFAGGDDTVFHTGWKNVEYDLTALRGMVVTLEVKTFDRGDSIYDTAGVCDNFRIELAPAPGVGGR